MRLTIREGFVGTRAISVGRVALRKSEADGFSQGHGGQALSRAQKV